MDSAIRAGYQSRAYPFLPTRTPTDSLSPAEIQQLSREEQLILEFKRFWLSTPYPEQVAAIVAQIIEDRRLSPISNVVCFGIPMLLGSGDVQQFVLLSQVVAQLAAAHPEIAANLIAQDPEMTPGARRAFENHGFEVVDQPAGSEFVVPNTLLMSPFVGGGHLYTALENRPTRELGMFLGNGRSLCTDLESRSTLVYMQSYTNTCQGRLQKCGGLIFTDICWTRRSVSFKMCRVIELPT